MTQRWHSPHGPEEVPAQAPDWSPPHRTGGVDPISVAFAALSSSRSEIHAGTEVSTGSTADGLQRPAGFRPDHRGEPLDPLAVTRAALESNQASHDGEDGSGAPLRARFGQLVERARSVIGSGDGETEGEAAPTAGGPMEGKQTDQARTTSAGSPSGSHESSPDDPGWVFHRRVGDGGHEGWLYHYADGTMVSEDGTVYEYPSHETDSLAHDPTVEDGTPDGGSGADQRNGEAPSQVNGAHEQAPSGPPADRDTEHAAVAEAAQHAQAPVVEDDTLPESQEDESESEARESEPEARESESEARESEPEQDTEDQGDDSDEDASVPEVEGGGGPVAAVTDAVAGVWLNDKAKGKETLEPADADDERTEQSASGASGSETVHIPAFIEYSPTNLLRYLSGGLFALAAIAAVMTIFYAVQAESMPHIVLGGVFVLIALLSSWVLLSWEPTVISIRQGILEVARGPHGEQVDLRDPRTEVEVGHNVSSPTWKTVVHRAGAKDLKIRAGQVKARQFAAIVEHYVSHPRQKPLDEDD